MKIIETTTVPADLDGMRISDCAYRLFYLLNSRKSGKKAVKEGRVYIHDEQAYTYNYVKTGQTVNLCEDEQESIDPLRFKMRVLYEDDVCAVVEKPPGLQINGPRLRTFERALPFNLKPTEHAMKLSIPRPAHRLDAATGGLVLVGKTTTSLIDFGRQFQEQAIKKRYRALVVGAPGREGTINSPVEDKESVTRFKTVNEVKSLKSRIMTLLDLWPSTGRKHQLRIHMASIGTPILGDRVYGIKGKIMFGKGLFLWAVELEFQHPEDGRNINITIEEPSKFKSVMFREQRRFNNYHDTKEDNL